MQVFTTVYKKVRSRLIWHLFKRTIAFFEQPDYADKVQRLAAYRYKVWEKAVGEAAMYGTEEDHDPDIYEQMAVEALEARAEFIDTMREYLGVDLISHDIDGDPQWPMRPVVYERKDTIIKVVGGDGTIEGGIPIRAENWVKVQSNEIPKLNYPRPHFQGTALREYRKELKTVMDLHNALVAQGRYDLIEQAQQEYLAKKEATT